VVLALLVLLLVGLLGLSAGPRSPAPAALPAPAARPVATLTQTLFSVDGRALDIRNPLRLRRGQVLRFPHGTENVRLNRLECTDDVHEIALRGSVSWRVPDLPSGEYLLSAVVLRNNVDYLVRVRSHSAPCPGG
jgi:hypothetical protein